MLFVNVWSQIKQIGVILSYLNLWIAAATHNLKWVKIKIKQAEQEFNIINAIASNIIQRKNILWKKC